MRTRRHDRRILAAAALAAVLAAGAAATASAQGPAAPTAQVVGPNLPADGPLIASPTVTLTFGGGDADAPDGLPTMVRFLFGRAEIGDFGSGTPLTTRAEFEAHVDELVTWDDPNWSDWTPFDADENLRRITFPGLAADRYYFFAVQTMDADGAVSLGRSYQVEVAHLYVQESANQPAVTLTEHFLGDSTADIAWASIAPVQPLNFSWTASADAYGGTIASYRWGWDLVDPDDPNDPGWAVPPGDLLAAPERTLADGIHVFTLRVEDDSGNATLRRWQLAVVPYVDYAVMKELLVIDQTIDANSQRWPDAGGIPRDEESYRNAFWQFLADGPGGVQGFDWNLDRIADTEPVAYADLVPYKAVLIYAKASPQQLMFQQFRPQGDRDRYVWLDAYQRRGNVMLVGAGSMESFLEARPDYMTPLVFDSAEHYATFGPSTFVVGFGMGEEPDGDPAVRGTLMYPYATAGLALLDWTASNTKYIYGRPEGTMAQLRRSDCVGIKALRVDPDFAARWGVTAADFADTVFTEAAIDWQDADYAAAGTLDVVHNTFPYRYDEFVDANVTDRTTAGFPQQCPDASSAPDGMCVEPMLRGVARFDWLRETKRAGGDAAWPDGTYDAAELDALCGDAALAEWDGLARGTAVTNGQVFGWLSHRMAQEKPMSVPDVYWGFDPYRFDHEQSRRMVRWALREVFQLSLNP